MIRSVHRFEEDVIFPMISTRLQDDEKIQATLNRLRLRALRGRMFRRGTDLKPGTALAIGTDDINVEATGYMLRGFFEAMRRHLAGSRTSSLLISE